YDAEPTQVRITTSYAYDKLNRRTDTIEALGSATAQRTATTLYDAEGNVTSVTTGIGTSNPKVVRTDTGYDALDRASTVGEAAGQPEQRTATVAFDAAGNVRSRTTGLGAAGYEKKVTTTYLYDKLNRQTEMTEAANDTAVPTVKRTTTTVYDAVGNVTKV